MMPRKDFPSETHVRYFGLGQIESWYCAFGQYRCVCRRCREVKSASYSWRRV